MDCLFVQGSITLCARAAHGKSLGLVESSELDGGGIRGTGHESVEGIDFADEMAFCDAAYAGIAAEGADCVGAVG